MTYKNASNLTKMSVIADFNGVDGELFRNWSTNTVNFSISNVSSQLNVAWGSNTNTNTGIATLSGPHIYTMDGNIAYQDESVINTFISSTFQSTAMIYIFGTGTVNLYKSAIFENGKLIQNLIPCYRISDGKTGMYDTVNDVFRANSGTGLFIRGPVIT